MTKYSRERKLKAVLTYLQGTASFKTIADQFNVGLTSLKDWLARYKANGAGAFYSSYTTNE